jgi:hypothetical protein
MSAAVDRHRQAVYDVEDAAFGGTTYDEPMPFADAADLATAFCAGGWWTATGLPVPHVVPTRIDSSQSYARCDGDPSIHLSPAGCTVATIAHELAHVAARRSGAVDEPDHGPAFRHCEISLVGALMGAAAADRLAAAFTAGGLDLDPDGGAMTLPPSSGGGYWITWRSARALTGAAPTARGPIAL